MKVKHCPFTTEISFINNSTLTVDSTKISLHNIIKPWNKDSNEEGRDFDGSGLLLSGRDDKEPMFSFAFESTDNTSNERIVSFYKRCLRFS